MPVDDRYELRDCGHETPCWVWLRSVGSHGYGQMRHSGTVRLAHCVFYEAQRGPVAAGLELDHLCQNRRCINPAHLEPVTHTENVRRALGISADLIGPIRAAYPSTGSARQVAARFGVSHTTVLKVCRG